jgi:hypothetical protein
VNIIGHCGCGVVTVQRRFLLMGVFPVFRIAPMKHILCRNAPKVKGDNQKIYEWWITAIANRLRFSAPTHLA